LAEMEKPTKKSRSNRFGFVGPPSHWQPE